MTHTFPTNSPIKPFQDFRRADGSVDWRRHLEYHTGIATTPQPPPTSYANPPQIPPTSIRSTLPTPPTSSVPSPAGVEESAAEGDDTEVEIEVEQGEGRILSTREPEQHAKHSLSGSSNSDSEGPLNLGPENTPPAEPESNTDKYEPELNADEHEPELNTDEHVPELNADEHDLEFNADTYEPENPEKYDLTEDDLAFFDRPHIPS